MSRACNGPLQSRFNTLSYGVSFAGLGLGARFIFHLHDQHPMRVSVV